MEVIGFGFTFLLLIAGIVLTVITLRRIAAGTIAVQGWARAFLIAGMILLQLILLLSILPPKEVDNIFVDESVTPVAPMESTPASIEADP